MAQLDEQVSEFLGRFEEHLLGVAVADSPFVTDAARHIIAAGGKRFRPLLVFLAAQFGQRPNPEALMRAATVMELTHVASLYHDDVMDEAELRRGAPSANRLLGNSVAILVGDFLFAIASKTVASLGTEYVRLQAETFARLVQGQIAETKGPGEADDPLVHYLDVIADKTGSLIAASARFGGKVAGVDADTLDALARFGEEVGLVFQLSDDLIDITSTATGKTPGTDLREGVPTLPVLMLRADNDPADGELLALIDSDLSSDDALSAALQRLRAHPVMDRARAEVRRRADLAASHLANLPECEAKDALVRVCRELIDRVA